MVLVVVERTGDLKTPTRVEEDSRVPVAKIFMVSSDCHAEDAGPVWVVIVGRLEQELHHPLAWQGWQSGQQVALRQVQFLLNFVDGNPRTEGARLYKSLCEQPKEKQKAKFTMSILPMTLNLVILAIEPLLSRLVFLTLVL